MRQELKHAKSERADPKRKANQVNKRKEEGQRKNEKCVPLNPTEPNVQKKKIAERRRSNCCKLPTEGEQCPVGAGATEKVA